MGGGFLRGLHGRYMSAEACENLKKYKYAGEDRSYLYVYVLTPMNARLINFIPTWVAPNLLTLTGLAVMLHCYAWTYYFSPNLDQVLPPWMYLLCCATLFFYQTVDNLDGRQARRTGSSSPLGLLFDHGVDALNVTIAAQVMAAVFQLGATWKLLLLWTTGFVPFVFATWEEYFTGSLILAEVNGPSDGMFLCMNFCIFGYFNPGAWAQTLATVFPTVFTGTSVADINLHYFPLILGWIGIFFTVIANAYQVTKYKSLTNGPLRLLVPFTIEFICCLTWYNLSPSDIFAQHPRIFLFLLGFLFGNMICSLMLAHITHMPYNIYRKVLLPFLLYTIHLVAHVQFKTPLLVPEETAVFVIFACHFSFWIHFVLNVIDEITELLKIRCFKITPVIQKSS